MQLLGQEKAPRFPVLADHIQLCGPLRLHTGAAHHPGYPGAARPASVANT